MASNGGLDGGYITELRPSDVLFGRGSGPNDHEGNIRFRQLVAERKAEYLATNHRQTKAKIAREIVDVVLNDNGRFLKKVEPFDARRLGIPKGVDAWMSVDEETIMEKAKQALRQNTNKGKPGEVVSSVTSGVAAGREKVSKEDSSVLPVSALSSGGIRQQADGNAQVESNFLRFNQKQPGNGVNDIDIQLQPNPIGWKVSEGDQILPVPLTFNTSSGSEGEPMGPPSARRGSKKEQFLNAQNQNHHETQYIMDRPISNAGGDGTLDGFTYSMQMSDLETSMSRLRTRDDKTQESTDTMGTIEPIGQEALGGNQRHMMSEASFNSSTFSLFNSMRGESMDELMAISRGASRENILDLHNQTKQLSEDDFNVSEVWGSNRGSLLERLIAEERAQAAADAKAVPSSGEPRRTRALGLMDEPRSLGLMEEEPDSLTNLGVSSMSILKSAFESTGGVNES